MTVEIDIDDYLSNEEKKQICIDYVKETLRGDRSHEERVLSNMAYNAAFAILDSVLTQEMMESIRAKATEQITKVSDFGIFRKKDAWGQEDSLAYLEVQKAVTEHKHLINPLVKQAILEHDYEKDLPDCGDNLSYCIIDALKKGLNA